MKNSAVVVGGGIVGKATAKALEISKIYDKVKERSNCTFEEADKYKYVFICVPTHSSSKGCDIAIVDEVIKKFNNRHIFVLRSTVTPGTAELLMNKYNVKIISNPEFLTEKTADKDTKNPDIIVIGSKSKKILKEIISLYYNHKKFPKSKIIKTDNNTAEMIKYGINTFYAVKVIFANYLYSTCNKKGINYNQVKNAMYKRKWIGNNHLAVPYKSIFGLRGKCLPNDLITFANYSKNQFFQKMVIFMNEINNWK